MAADLVGEESAQSLERETGSARSELHEGFRRLAAIAVGNSDHDHFLDVRMLVNRFLDHARIDIETAGNNHVLLAVDDKQKTVLVHVANIAGQPEAVDETLGGLLRPVPIAGHDIRPFDADLAGLADRKHAARIVERDDLDHDAGQRNTGGAALAGPRNRLCCSGGRRLRHADAGAQDLSGQLLPAVGDLHRQGCAAGAAAHQGGQIAFLNIGMAAKRHPHGRHAVEMRGTANFNVVQCGLDIEFLAQQHFIAVRQMPQHHGRKRKNMK